MSNDVDYVQNSIVKYYEVHSSQKNTSSAPERWVRVTLHQDKFLLHKEVQIRKGCEHVQC